MKEKYIITRRHFLGYLGLTPFALAGVSNRSIWQKPEPLLRFGMVTDSHYADREPSGIRFYQEALGKMQECVEVMNEEGVSMLIHLGDFKDEDKEPTELKTVQYLKDLEAVYGQFKGPRYHAMGNHDLDSISKEQFLEHVENTGIPKTEGYYSFEQGGVNFIVLDANFHKDGRHHHKGDFEWHDAHIPKKQRKWLKKTLKASAHPSVIFIHHTLHEVEKGPFHVTACEDIRKILERSGKVLAVFEGHHHDELYTQINGIHYYILPAMVDHSGLDNNAFAIATVFSNGNIEIEGYKRVKDQLLST